MPKVCARARVFLLRPWQCAMMVGILIFGSIGFATAAQADAPLPIPVPRNGTAASATAPISPVGNVSTPQPDPSVNPMPPSRGVSSSASSSSPTALPRPASRSVEIGAYVPGAAQNTALLDQFETMTNHQMAIVHWYQPWGYDNGTYTAALDTGALNAVAARGATPLITWEAWGLINSVDPSHVANISTGAFDAYIDSWATGLKAFGKPVYLRLFHEMNFQGYPWAYGTNGNTAQDLVTAWRYVHDRFARSGAANVRWVWCPNPDNGLVPFDAIYPGDAYVDWLGVDAYNGGTQFDWGGWRSAQQIIDQTYRIYQAISPTKPIMLAEVSSVEQGGSKAQWITDLFNAAPASLPNIRAIVWFHDNWTTVDARNLPVADWRVNTSPAALQAFRDA